MKIKIKSFNGELPSYLTVGKVYEVDCVESFTSVSITSDLNKFTVVRITNCPHLNGGSWEIVDETQ